MSKKNNKSKNEFTLFKKSVQSAVDINKTKKASKAFEALEEKTYTKSKRPTFYDIPSFGYKSAFLIMIVAVIAYFFLPFLCYAIWRDKVSFVIKLSISIFASLFVGFFIAYRQYFYEKQAKKVSIQFILVGTLFTIVGFIAMLFVYALA